MKRWIQFHKDNIQEEWEDFVNMFPTFFMEPSPSIIESTNNGEYGKNWPNTLEECCNLRYGVECPIEWKSLLIEYFTYIDSMLRHAEVVGDDVHYKGCILKEKWHVFEDQGDFYGKDYKKYVGEYDDLKSKAREASKVIKVERKW